jgi:hypothetical protein
MPIGLVEKVTLQPLKAPVIARTAGTNNHAATDLVIVSSPLL